MNNTVIKVKTEDTFSEIGSVKFENTNRETNSYDLLKLCQTCVMSDSRDSLKDMMQTHVNDGRIEVYSDMLEYCFNLQMGDNQRERLENIYMICDICILKLREIVSFRNQVEAAQKNIDSKILRAKLKNNLSVDVSDSGDEIKSGDEEKDNFIASLDEEYTSSDSITVDYSDKQNNKPAVNNNQRDREKIILQKVGEKLTPKHLRKYYTHNQISGMAKTPRGNEIPFVLSKGQKQCKICQEHFDSENGLKIHMSVHYPNFICKICGRLFYNRMGILMHLRSHSSERFECPKCPGKAFKRKRSLLIHEKLKHSNDPNIHKCQYCGERFKYHHQRMRHFITAHNKMDELKKYKCKFCNKSFQLANARSSHIRRAHLLERNHSCAICGNQFFSRSDLEKHQLSHTGIRNFFCSVCNKSYLRKSTLTEHMKIHTGERNHICDVCNKAFTQKCTLKAHLLSLHNLELK